MAKTDALQGSLDLLVLKILSRRPQLHGYAIMAAIANTSGEVLRAEEGSLYPALYRMEEAGWIRAEWIKKDSGRRARVYELTTAGKKRLELARALSARPRLLLLDEVLAGLNPSEVRDMVPVIRAIADRGVTIVMIEHVMQAVISLAEHVLVLSEGRIIAEGSPQRIASDARVVEAYLGRGHRRRRAAP